MASHTVRASVNPETHDRPRISPHVLESQHKSRLVHRDPRSLRLHPALEKLESFDAMGELNQAALTDVKIPQQPTMITESGVVLSGLGVWRLAILEQRPEIECIEYAMDVDDSLRFLLAGQQLRHGWNSFVRIRLALSLESSIQKQALENMRLGGKFKGWANLPDAARIDVRKKIGKLAGTGTRNVTNVKRILDTAHPRLIEALTNGSLTINCAIGLCKFSKGEQVDRFIRLSEDRENHKVIRLSLQQSKEEGDAMDAVSIFTALAQLERAHPGSLQIQLHRSPRVVLLVSQTQLAALASQFQLEIK